MVFIKNYLPFFCFIILFNGCIYKNTDGQIVPSSDGLPTVITYDDATKKVLCFSEFVQSVDFLPLEDCQEALISEVEQIEVTNNGDYLVFDRNLHKIVRFDSLGNYLNLIGEIGHGPNEFVSPISIAYNPFTDHVFVIDNGCFTLLEYDLKGTLVRRISPIPFYATEMGIVDVEHYCFYSDFVGNDGGFNYHITDTEFRPIGCFEPFHTIQHNGIVAKVFARSNNVLIGKSPGSNYLYKISVDSITPLYQMECKLAGPWLSEKDPDLLRNKLINSKISYCLNTFFSDNYVIFENVIHEDGHPRCIVVYNNKTGEVLSGKTLTNDLIQEYTSSSIIHEAHDNKLITILYPEDYQRRIGLWQSALDEHKSRLSPERINEFQSFIDHDTAYSNKMNVILQISYLKH